MGANAYEIVHMGNYTTLLDARYVQISSAKPQSYFQSSQQVITSGGSLTIAHGLGVMPPLVQIVIQCVTAELGYSIGDELVINSTLVPGSGAGVAVVPDATNLVARFGSSSVIQILLRKDTGVGSTVAVATWKLVLRGPKMTTYAAGAINPLAFARGDIEQLLQSAERSARRRVR